MRGFFSEINQPAAQKSLMDLSIDWLIDWLIYSSLLLRAALPAIRRIRISRSLWEAKVFTKKLLGHLTRRSLNSDDIEDITSRSTQAMESSTETAAIFCRTFVDEFLGRCPAGTVPDLRQDFF